MVLFSVLLEHVIHSLNVTSRVTRPGRTLVALIRGSRYILPKRILQVLRDAWSPAFKFDLFTADGA